MDVQTASRSLEMRAELRFLPAAVNFARDFFQGFPDIQSNQECLYNLQLAVSEALTNVMKHAYPPESPGSVTLGLKRERDAAVITITDGGIPFDPSAVPPPDLDDPQGHGLGMYFLRELMDSVEYGRTGNVNTLTITKKIPSCAQL
jgi:serine/threonine-protein kinase RsbW